MPQDFSDDPTTLIREVSIGAHGKGVFANTIQHLHLGAEPVFAQLGPFDTVPPLPSNFIARPEILETLIDNLLSKDSAVGLVSLEGMGGIGKSVAALSLCHDPRVREAFPDGIIWIPVGRQPAVTISQRVEAVANAFNLRFRNYDEAAYRSLMAQKAALIVLDDVWSLDAAEPFLPPQGRSRLLYTSRDRNLSGRLGARSHAMEVLSPTEAGRFLLRWSGRENRPPPEQQLREILLQCKGLVLALAIVGARLRGQDDREWGLVIDDLHKIRLEHLGDRPGRYQYKTLDASIAVSVDALDLPFREAYLRLAVLLEDMAAPETLLQAIWGVDLDEVHRITRVLVDRSLASRDAEGALHLHDLLLDYVCAEYPDKDALARIHAALLRSLHLVQWSPAQFSSQMIGRLLSYGETPGISSFVQRLDTHDPLPRLRPLTPALQPAGGRLLEGHGDQVFAVAISQDGRRVISGARDKTARVWELEGGGTTQVLDGHSAWVNSVALSADGSRAVSGSQDKTIRVWELGGGPSRILEGHTDSVDGVAMSADGHLVISGSFDGTVRIWDADGDKPPRVLKGSEGPVSSVALSASGRFAVSGSLDKTVRVWDLDFDEPPRLLTGHRGSVSCVAMTADGRRVVSGAHDSTVRVWDLQGGAPPRVLEGHTGIVYAVAVAADGSQIISGATDKTMRVWNLEDEDRSRVLEGHAQRILGVALSADGKCAVSGSSDQTVRVWELDGIEPPRLENKHGNWVGGVALSANGERAVSGSGDHRLRVWALNEGVPPQILEGHSDKIYAVAISADGRRAISGSTDKTVRVWNLGSDVASKVLEGHTDKVNAVSISADGRRGASASDDKTIRIWDLDSDAPSLVLEGHRRAIRAVAMSADGRRVASASDDKTVRVWDLDTKASVGVFKIDCWHVTAVAFLSDGRRLVVGAEQWEGDGAVQLWELGGEEPLQELRLEGDRGLVHAVAVSPDNRHCVCCIEYGTVLVLELSTLRPVFAFTCDSAALCCAWSGDRVIVGDVGGHMHVLRWEEGAIRSTA
jgi:WD40 repeat protein